MSTLGIKSFETWKTHSVVIWVFKILTFFHNLPVFIYFLEYYPGGLGGKESACNARDPGSVPGLRRYPVEGNGYPLQYSWASLVPQLEKNPPAMPETWVRSLGWEDPLETGKATHSSILSWGIPGTI